MNRVHEDALGVRQAIQIGVHESTSGRQEENATSQIHDELGGMHEDLRLACAGRPAQEAATPLHVGIELPDAVEVMLLPNEIEEATLVVGPGPATPIERLAANDGTPQDAIKKSRRKKSRPRNSRRSSKAALPIRNADLGFLSVQIKKSRLRTK
jgi:hypothetical protein